MPRPAPPSPVAADRILIPADAQNRMAAAVGLEELPPWCASTAEEILGWYLKVIRTDETREHKTTRDNVIAALRKVSTAVEQLIAVDSGVDDETRRRLYSSGAHLVEKIGERMAELEKMPRVHTRTEALRLVGPAFKCLLARLGSDPGGPSPEFLSPYHSRRFVFEAFSGTGIELGIDEAHLDRLDEYLNAQPAF